MWLRDLQLIDGRAGKYTGIAVDLDLFAVQVVDLYLRGLRRKVRTSRTAKVVVTLYPPAVLAASRFVAGHVALIDWPCDVGSIERRDDGERKRLLLDVLHDALSAMAVACGWDVQPALDDARQSAIDAGLVLRGLLLRRPVRSPDHFTAVMVAYEYVGTALVVTAVFTDRHGTETSRVELLRTTPVARLSGLVTHMAWQGNRRINVRLRSVFGTTSHVVRLGPPTRGGVDSATTRTALEGGSAHAPTSRAGSRTGS